MKRNGKTCFDYWRKIQGIQVLDAIPYDELTEKAQEKIAELIQTIRRRQVGIGSQVATGAMGPAVYGLGQPHVAGLIIGISILTGASVFWGANIREHKPLDAIGIPLKQNRLRKDNTASFNSLLPVTHFSVGGKKTIHFLPISDSVIRKWLAFAGTMKQKIQYANFYGPPRGQIQNPFFQMGVFSASS